MTCSSSPMPQAAREITINRLRTALGTDRHRSAMTPQGVTYMSDQQASTITLWVQIIGILVVVWTAASIGSGLYAWGVYRDALYRASPAFLTDLKKENCELERENFTAAELKRFGSNCS